MSKAKAPQITHQSAMTAVLSIANDTEHDPRKGKPNTKTDAGLMRSIARVGLLQSIAVEQIDPDAEGHTFRVAAGRRRLRACKTLIEKKLWTPDSVIPAIIVDAATAAQLRTMALAENTQREAIHPIDAYEQVCDIMADGGDEKDAAESLGLSVLQVRQYEALGKIHPDIRAAWRAGKLDETSAKAFTLTDDLDRQIEVYNRLKKSGMLYSHGVRHALGANSHDTRNALAAVGEKAYVKAGGSLKRDLFDTDTIIISDTALLSRMASELLEAECKRLIADGWSWALSADTIQNRYAYRDILIDIPVTEAEQAEMDAAEKRIAEIEDADDATEDMAKETIELDKRLDEIRAAAFERACTPELKAATGCIVSLRHGGIDIDYGRAAPGSAAAQQPERADDTTGQGDEKDEPTNAAISAALTMRLSAQVTTAAAHVVARNPALAIKLLTAGLNGSYRAPIKVTSQGLGVDHAQVGGNFAEAFRDATGTYSELASTVAKMLDMTIRNAGGPRLRETQVLLDAIGVDAYEAAALEVFDPVDYFTSASSARIDEFVADINANRADGDHLKPPKGKKAEKAAWAAARAKEELWLPPEMRFSVEKLSEPPQSIQRAGDDEEADEGDEEDGDHEEGDTIASAPEVARTPMAEEFRESSETDDEAA